MTLCNGHQRTPPEFGFPISQCFLLLLCADSSSLIVSLSCHRSTFPKMCPLKQKFHSRSINLMGVCKKPTIKPRKTLEKSLLKKFSVAVIDPHAEGEVKDAAFLQFLCPQNPFSGELLAGLSTHRAFSEKRQVPGSPDSTRTPRNVSPRMVVCASVAVSVCMPFQGCSRPFAFCLCFAQIFHRPLQIHFYLKQGMRKLNNS